METFRIIGLMSGTSLDGLDIADVLFTYQLNQGWNFELQYAETVPYPLELKMRLTHAVNTSASDLEQLDEELTAYYANQVNAFLFAQNIDKKSIHAVASHGHTVFHQPERGITRQIGNGSAAAKISGLTWVCDFRKEDVALGGNGAPLVPVGDHMLFKRYASSFLNLGGFSNVSFSNKEKVLAYDICPVNLVLNQLTHSINSSDYDAGGILGRQGTVNKQLLNKLNDLAYYRLAFPKSLGIEWLHTHFFPLLPENRTVDVLATCYHHIAHQISSNLNDLKKSSVLVTGGGAKNRFLMELIAQNYSGEIVLPDQAIIDFKEAIVFGFLGVLRLKKEINIYASVTGAKTDSCSGVVHLP